MIDITTLATACYPCLHCHSTHLPLENRLSLLAVLRVGYTITSPWKSRRNEQNTCAPSLLVAAALAPPAAQP
jgi:hypothetical protein